MRCEVVWERKKPERLSRAIDVRELRFQPRRLCPVDADAEVAVLLGEEPVHGAERAGSPRLDLDGDHLAEKRSAFRRPLKVDLQQMVEVPTGEFPDKPSLADLTRSA